MIEDKGSTAVRVIGILIIFSGVIMGCEIRDPCIRVGAKKDFGLDHLEKIKLVSNHTEELGLSTTTEEVAYIVGTAYAASQLEGGQHGVPVSICFRAGKADDTEYRVLSKRQSHHALFL